jgi:predicted DNA-binding transcriptional regulator YafY
MTRIERMMAEVLLLQERGRSCEEIARALEVSRRTVMRDVQALCEMGIPVMSRDGAGGGYSLSPHYGIQPLELTWQEALLLLMALDGLAKMSDSPFSAERSSLTAKLRPLIPHKHLERLEGLRENVGLEVPGRTMRAPMLDAIVEQVGTGDWVCVEYAGAEGPVKRIIRPARVYADRGLWYLAAFDGKINRTLRVDRIRAVQPAEAPESVTEPVPYDHPSHPTVRVKVNRKAARMIERDPHMGPNVNPDLEEQWIEFRCPPSELDWYASYFGSMAGDAVVFEPDELKVKIVDRAQLLLDLYRK